MFENVAGVGTAIEAFKKSAAMTFAAAMFDQRGEKRFQPIAETRSASEGTSSGPRSTHASSTGKFAQIFGPRKFCTFRICISSSSILCTELGSKGRGVESGNVVSPGQRGNVSIFYYYYKRQSAMVWAFGSESLLTPGGAISTLLHFVNTPALCRTHVRQWREGKPIRTETEEVS